MTRSARSVASRGTEFSLRVVFSSSRRNCHRPRLTITTINTSTSRCDKTQRGRRAKSHIGSHDIGSISAVDRARRTCALRERMGEPRARRRRDTQRAPLPPPRDPRPPSFSRRGDPPARRSAASVAPPIHHRHVGLGDTGRQDRRWRVSRRGRRREVLEETGWQPGPLRPLTSFHPTNGISDQTFHIFLGEGATYIGEPTDRSEATRVEWVSITRLRELIASDAIRDGLSLCAHAVARPRPALTDHFRPVLAVEVAHCATFNCRCDKMPSSLSRPTVTPGELPIAFTAINTPGMNDDRSVVS